MEGRKQRMAATRQRTQIVINVGERCIYIDGDRQRDDARFRRHT